MSFLCRPLKFCIDLYRNFAYANEFQSAICMTDSYNQFLLYDYVHCLKTESYSCFLLSQVYGDHLKASPKERCVLAMKNLMKKMTKLG